MVPVSTKVPVVDLVNVPALLIWSTFFRVPEANVVVVRLLVAAPFPPMFLPAMSSVPPSRLSTAVLVPVWVPRMMSPATVSVPPVRFSVPAAAPPAAEASPSLIAIPALAATVTVPPETFRVPEAVDVVPAFTPIRSGLVAELNVELPVPPRVIVAVEVAPVVVL